MNTFLLSSTSNDFTTYLKPPIRLDPSKCYEAALLSIDTFNSFPNVTDENNELKYTTDDGATWKIIKLAKGSYELSSINDEIQRQMVANGDYESNTTDQFYVTITANVSTLKSIVEVTNQRVQVDLGTVGPTLGFPAGKVLEYGYHESPSIVDIMKINSILVKVDIISGSYVNGSQSPVIYSFYPNVAPGRKIVERPSPSLIYYPVNRREIDSIRVWLTDQDNRPIDFRGERVTVRLCIREVFDLKREIKEAISLSI